MKKIKLGDVLDVKRGASLSGQFYSNKGNYIRLTLGNFNYPNGGFKLNTAKDDLFFVGDVKPEFIMKKGDIITPLTEQVYGLLGETATIPEDDLFIQSGDIGLIIPNPDEVDNRFVYYLVSSAIVRKQLGAAAQQTKIRHTSPEKIKDCIAFLPKMDQQKRISMLMDNINEKIALNNKIIFELESMAKTLYDYWFLQFDFPDENGKPYKSSGGKMVYNEELKREIPEGWEVSDLEKIVTVTRGVMYSPDEVSDTPNYNNTPLIKSNNLQNGRINFDSIIYVDKKKVSNEQYLTKNSVFVTMSSGSAEHVGKTAIIFEDLSYCYGGFCAKISILPLYRGYLSLFFISEYFKRKLHAIIVGTSIKNINNNHLTKNKLPIPPTYLLNEFENIISSNFDMQGKIIKENRDLASLRDFLLPMLMNGQVTFKDAAEAHND